MELVTTKREDCYGLRFAAQENGQEIGHAYLYIFFNDLHAEPYGMLEDVFVAPHKRGSGIGTELVRALIAEAKNRGCYKLIGTSRHSREDVHAWYERLGFENYGVEFRLCPL